MIEKVGTISSNNVLENSEILEARFNEIKNKQGFLGSVWNEIKESTGCGVSSIDCRSMLDKYNNGEVSFEEALEYINGFDTKQSNMSDLGANIITGVASIAAATALFGSAPLWALAFAIGAPVGAVVKTGIKILDRATNNIKDDEFDGKQILKDAISGAVTGTASAVSSGVGAGIKAGSLKLAVKNGTKCGVQCGALAGSTSYITNVALDNDKYFNTKDFIKNTLTSAFVSGTVGAVVGAGMYGLSNNVGQEVSKTVRQTIVDDSASSSTRKVLGEAERSLMSIA